MAAIDTCYTSACCNRTPHCASCGRNGLVCFGSCRAVVIYRPHTLEGDGGILAMEAGHTSRVNCAKWVPRRDGGLETELVSGSVDGAIVLWKWLENKLQVASRWKGHGGAVDAVDALYRQEDGGPLLLASASADSTTKLWTRDSAGEVVLMQTLSWNNGFCLDLALLTVPGTQLAMLACGCDDQKVHIYIEQNEQFVAKHKLAGHEDWLRSVDFAIDDSGDVLLASSGQDNVICVWRLAARAIDSQQAHVLVRDLPLEEDIQHKEDMLAYTYKGQEKFFALSLDSVLVGHDNWVYSVQWQPFLLTDGGRHQPLCLLSASMDKTAILWHPDPDSGIWVEKVRLGVVGGNTLGFYGAVFGADGQSLIAHGYQGALQQWRLDTTTDSWLPGTTVGGHFDEVSDLAWEEGGDFLVSVSVDQTSRLHAPALLGGRQTGWVELSRPQVHGYDLQCLAMLGRYGFASGADEKVIRVFRAPRFFVENFCRLCGHDVEKELSGVGLENLPEGASVPVLGLSNLAVSGGATQEAKEAGTTFSNPQDYEMCGTPVILDAPPTEKELLQDTLWVETKKLYGHGYEIFALDANPSGTYLASACKAAKAEFAAVLVWSMASGEQVACLRGPTLTVTQLAWSHSGRLLLAVSRDRTWAVWQMGEQGTSPGGQEQVAFSLLGGVSKQSSPHSRIIWACAWTPEDHYFATASRDKKVLMWSTAVLSADKTPKPDDCLDLGEAVTAVSIAPTKIGESYLVAVGLESGAMQVHSWRPRSSASGDCKSWQLAFALPTLHHLAVKRLRFRPRVGLAGQQGEEGKHLLQLASCSSDQSVKVVSLDTHQLMKS